MSTERNGDGRTEPERYCPTLRGEVAQRLRDLVDDDRYPDVDSGQDAISWLFDHADADPTQRELQRIDAAISSLEPFVDHDQHRALDLVRTLAAMTINEIHEPGDIRAELVRTLERLREDDDDEDARQRIG